MCQRGDRQAEGVEKFVVLPRMCVCTLHVSAISHLMPHAKGVTHLASATNMATMMMQCLRQRQTACQTD